MLSTGVQGNEFEWTFKAKVDKRKYYEKLMDLDLTLHEISAKVPAGMLVFFPSYSMMTEC